ncbi:MAG: hypothetical protein HUU41_03175 [Bryobacteraceae bacterium]|nr:hypothetical protein [Bryobacterales bacterium]NUN00093.1 hypothetical protein [Bryobacteraceae bacterium]
MHPLLKSLMGRDRRSIGESRRVASLVPEQPELIAVLVQGIESTHPVLRARAADAMEKVTAVRPELLVAYKKELLRRFSRVEQQEVRWHVAPMLARLPLSQAEETAVLNILLSYTDDRSSIVKTMAMQALADIALRSLRCLPEVQRHIEKLTATGTPAMKARGRKLLKQLAKSA